MPPVGRSNDEGSAAPIVLTLLNLALLIFTLAQTRSAAAERVPPPYVICHMCTTIDGRILSNRWPPLPGGQDPGELFERTADSFGIEAWLVGTTTMREFAGRNVRLKAARQRVQQTDHVADRHA